MLTSPFTSPIDSMCPCSSRVVGLVASARFATKTGFDGWKRRAMAARLRRGGAADSLTFVDILLTFVSQVGDTTSIVYHTTHSLLALTHGCLLSLTDSVAVSHLFSLQPQGRSGSTTTYHVPGLQFLHTEFHQAISGNCVPISWRAIEYY